MDSACCLYQEAADAEFSPDITFNHPLTTHDHAIANLAPGPMIARANDADACLNWVGHEENLFVADFCTICGRNGQRRAEEEDADL